MSPPEPFSGAVRFAPGQQQRWSLYAGIAEVVKDAPAKREIVGWSVLAVASLAIAGMFALLLALSRVPDAAEAVSWPVQFFEKGLVVHVVLSFIVWIFAVMCALMTLAAGRLAAGPPRWRILGPTALCSAWLATMLLLIPAWLDRGEPSLNNYVPAIIDPLYYLGLVLLAAGVALAAIRVLANLAGRKGPLEPVSLAVSAAALLYLLAMACFVLAFFDLAADTKGDIGAAFNEDLFWGGGHVLQFVNVGLLLGSWYVLGGLTLAEPLVHPRLMTVALGLLVVAALPAPFLYGGIVLEPFSFTHKQVFTNMQYLLAPPVLLVSVGAATTLFRHARVADGLPWHDPILLSLVTSLGVFMLGAGLGLFVDGADTRTPAHYHGVIGGINLAFMGLFFGLFLPLLGCVLERNRAAKASVWLYAVGQAAHAIGLFWAGGYGAPRKTMTAGGLDALGPTIGLYMVGVGAVIAVVGGVMFIVLVCRAFLRRR
jgi:hypothetical protein